MLTVQIEAEALWHAIQRDSRLIGYVQDQFSRRGPRGVLQHQSSQKKASKSPNIPRSARPANDTAEELAMSL